MPDRICRARETTQKRAEAAEKDLQNLTMEVPKLKIIAAAKSEAKCLAAQKATEAANQFQDAKYRAREAMLSDKELTLLMTPVMNLVVAWKSARRESEKAKSVYDKAVVQVRRAKSRPRRLRDAVNNAVAALNLATEAETATKTAAIEASTIVADEVAGSSSTNRQVAAEVLGVLSLTLTEVSNNHFALVQAAQEQAKAQKEANNAAFRVACAEKRLQKATARAVPILRPHL